MGLMDYLQKEQLRRALTSKGILVNLVTLIIVLIIQYRFQIVIPSDVVIALSTIISFAFGYFEAGNYKLEKLFERAKIVILSKMKQIKADSLDEIEFNITEFIRNPRGDKRANTQSDEDQDAEG